ncbi:MAG: NADH-quinone oxidoreductase subunit NuoK [Candidatus Heimdallarchaeota archaeon]|nr:NADH-quinone oxidoreductase subunit NuoK [Candidatus Heimdallarchaeota archaeon]
MVAIGTYGDFEVILVLSLMMLIIGVYGLVSKKSAIKVIMAIEILVGAPNLAFIAFGYAQGTVDPMTEAFVIISLSVGAAVIGLSLAFLRNLWKHFHTTEVDAYTTLKG